MNLLNEIDKVLSDKMKTLDVINKTKEYLNYLEEHILNVQKAWSELQVVCGEMDFIQDDFLYGRISDGVIQHDMSKLSEQEFIQYRKSFYPTDQESKIDLGSAWDHHKSENPHHWENWTTSNFSDQYEWKINCVHMLIDWMAMGYKFNDTAQKYYESNKDKIELPGYAIKYMYEIFNCLNNKEIS